MRIKLKYTKKTTLTLTNNNDKISNRTLGRFR